MTPDSKGVWAGNAAYVTFLIVTFLILGVEGYDSWWIFLPVWVIASALGMWTGVQVKRRALRREQR